MVLKKPFDRALARQVRLVVVVDIGGDEVGRFGVGARDQQRRHAHHVGRETRRDQLGHRFARRHQHLAAHVAALLHRRELVLEVHAGGAGVDHRLHQFEGVQHAAKAGLRIGNDRREVVDVAGVVRVLAFHPLDLVGARERIVDAANHRRHRVGGIQRLVRIHLAGDIGVARDLPARQVDGLEAGLHLLHRLVAGQRAERVHERLVVDQSPQLFGTALGQRVFNLHRAAQAHDVLGGVAALDALPARVFVPLFLQALSLEFTCRHSSLLRGSPDFAYPSAVTDCSESYGGSRSAASQITFIRLNYEFSMKQ